MGKVLHKVFKAVVNKLNNALPYLVELGSEVSHFIPEPSKFSEVTGLPEDVKIGLDGSNFERDQKCNQQSDPYNELPIEGRYIDTIYGCLQVKYPI